MYNILPCDVVQGAQSLLPRPGVCTEESVEQILGLVLQRLRGAALETFAMNLDDGLKSLLTDSALVEDLRDGPDQERHFLGEAFRI